MNHLRRWAAAALAATLACASQPVRGWREPPPASTPPAEIRRVALVIEHDHLTPVTAASLLRAAAGALDQEAGAGPAGEPPADPGAALDAALARLHAARPEITDAGAIGIAVQAMARSLADASRYMGPKEVQRHYLLPGSSSQVRGAVGVVIKKGNPYPSILRAIPGSPAAAGGVEAGSELRSVDNRPTAGMALDEVTDILAGPLGSEARLALGTPGGPERVLVVRRAKVDSGTVDCRILGGRILYLGVREFTAQTAPRVQGFAKAQGEPVRLVILDLRGNQGGLLAAAVDLADEFLASGPILSVHFRGPGGVQSAAARPDTSPLESARLAVLVDGETASGAAAVAAAIQDNRRGIVVGAKTSAAASVDTMVSISGGGILRLVRGRLFRASGQPVDGGGVSPTVTADATEVVSQPLSDVACSGFASPGPVARDPAVARAAAYLFAP